MSVELAAAVVRVGSSGHGAVHVPLPRAECDSIWLRSRATPQLELAFPTERGFVMLSWALAFFVIAVIAAIFGFGNIAAGAAAIAKILFFLFLVLFVVALIGALIRGRPPRPPT
jgi:uncharacterized membrane protein YtjA (UPF0391 family)